MSLIRGDMHYYIGEEDNDPEDPSVSLDPYSMPDEVWAVQSPGGMNPFQGTPQVTTKIPPSFNGTGSWFAFEESVEDWQDITELEDVKRGPALRNRLEGAAQVYRNVLDRDTLKQPEGVKYFLATLRPYFVKGNQAVFVWRFFQFLRMYRGSSDLHRWTTRLTIALKRTYDAWMDLCPAVTEHAVQLRTANMLLQFDQLDPNVHAHVAAQAYAAIQNDIRIQHTAQFPLRDNLTTLMALVMADLNERQREVLMQSFYQRGVNLPDLTFDGLKEAMITLLCAPRSSVKNPTYSSGATSVAKSFVVLDYGEIEGIEGYWVEDDPTSLEGFVEECQDAFWTYDPVASTWAVSRFRGRTFRKGKAKGKGKKGSSKGRPLFRSRKGKGKGNYYDHKRKGHGTGKGKGKAKTHSRPKRKRPFLQEKVREKEKKAKERAKRPDHPPMEQQML